MGRSNVSLQVMGQLLRAHECDATVTYVHGLKCYSCVWTLPLRDNENVPLTEPVEEYFEREVLPHVPDAWIDKTKKDAKHGHAGMAGYELNFKCVPPRSLKEIDDEINNPSPRAGKSKKPVLPVQISTEVQKITSL